MLQTEWLGFAEGSVADHRGNATLVGFGLQAVPIPLDALPAVISFAVANIIAADDEDIRPGADLALSANLTDPDGNVLYAVDEHMQVPDRAFPGLPPRIQVVLEVRAEFKVHGPHRVSVSFAPDGSTPLVSERVLHLIPPP